MSFKNGIGSQITLLKAMLDTALEHDIPVSTLQLNQLKVRIDELIEINGRKNSTVKAPVRCSKCQCISTYA
jgi:hypothetical protein